MAAGHASMGTRKSQLKIRRGRETLKARAGLNPVNKIASI